jgi:hypothetical protein
MESNVHRSQNRIESYHQLRSTNAKALALITQISPTARRHILLNGPRPSKVTAR